MNATVERLIPLLKDRSFGVRHAAVLLLDQLGKYRAEGVPGLLVPLFKDPAKEVAESARRVFAEKGMYWATDADLLAGLDEREGAVRGACLHHLANSGTRDRALRKKLGDIRRWGGGDHPLLAHTALQNHPDTSESKRLAELASHVRPSKEMFAFVARQGPIAAPFEEHIVDVLRSRDPKYHEARMSALSGAIPALGPKGTTAAIGPALTECLQWLLRNQEGELENELGWLFHAIRAVGTHAACSFDTLVADYWSRRAARRSRHTCIEAIGSLGTVSLPFLKLYFENEGGSRDLTAADLLWTEPTLETGLSFLRGAMTSGTDGVFYTLNRLGKLAAPLLPELRLQFQSALAGGNNYTQFVWLFAGMGDGAAPMLAELEEARPRIAAISKHYEVDRNLKALDTALASIRGEAAPADWMKAA